MRKFINYIPSEILSEDDKYQSFQFECSVQSLSENILNK